MVKVPIFSFFGGGGGGGGRAEHGDSVGCHVGLHLRK